MSINAAMDTFFTIIQREAMYLEEIVTIYTSTLLTVNVLLICIISYFVLRNVRTVFPQCQHCAVGCCLVNSLPISVLHKVHKFYVKSEKSMNLMDNEHEAKHSVERMGSDDADSESTSSESDSSDSEEDNHGHSPQGHARHHQDTTKISRISFASPGHEQKKRRKSSLTQNSRHIEQKGSLKRGKHHRADTDIEMEDITIRIDDNAQQQTPSIKSPVASLTKQNLREYMSEGAMAGSTRNFLSREETRAQSQLWASGSLACSVVHESSLPQQLVPAQAKGLPSPRTVPEPHESRTSSAFASFRSDLDVLVQEDDITVDRGNAPVIASPRNATGDDVSDSQEAESDWQSESESARLDSDYVSDREDRCVALRAGQGSQLIPTSTSSDASISVGLPPKSSQSKPTKLEIRESTVNGFVSRSPSGKLTGSSILLRWNDWSRRVLELSKRACLPAKARVGFQAGSGIARVAGALRSMLKQTSFNQLMDPHADTRHGYQKPSSGHQDDPDHEHASFEENIRRAAANQLAWYFRTSVYTVILSMVLVFCFCVWLVPQRIIHQLISTSLLMRFSRFSSVGISKSVFLIRELVLADGFARMSNAALAGHVEECKSDLLSAVTGFRLGQQDGFNIQGADYIESDVMSSYKDVMYKVLTQSTAMTRAIGLGHPESQITVTVHTLGEVVVATSPITLLFLAFCILHRIRMLID
jgi:hypothetical protein